MTLQEGLILVFGQPQTLAGWVMFETYTYFLLFVFTTMLVFGLPYMIWWGLTHR